VILDVACEDPRWRAWSGAAIEQAANDAAIVINSIIYAEVSIGCAHVDHVEVVLPVDRVSS
jgi:hypothetical protein